MPNVANLIIAGVNKAGTTSLFTYLTEHPEVCPSIVKETCHFLPIRFGEKTNSDEEYFEFFKHCDAQRYIVESTPGYFYGGKEMADTLNKIVADMKIIVVLREPVDRLFSFFRYKKDMMKLPREMAFSSYLYACDAMSIQEKRKKYNDAFWGVEGGMYSNYIHEWFDVFNGNLKVVFFDNLRENPQGVLEEICNWLNLDPSPYQGEKKWSIENRTIQYKSALLHRPALYINKRFENYFRAFPIVKRFIRKIYILVNEKHSEDLLTQEEQLKAEGLFKDSNKCLALLLKERGYHNLPKWLDDI